MQAALNVVFTKIQENKGIKLFGGRSILEMIKEFKQLNKWAIPVNPVIIPLNPDKLNDA